MFKKLIGAAGLAKDKGNVPNKNASVVNFDFVEGTEDEYSSAVEDSEAFTTSASGTTTMAQSRKSMSKSAGSAHKSSKVLRRISRTVSAKPEPADFLRGKFHDKFPLAANVLLAYMGFKQPARKHREYLIPKDRAAWLEFLVGLCKKRTNIEYLSDKELRKVIQRARPNLAGKKPLQKLDSDSPLCLYWSTELVAEWISKGGFPYLKEAFLVNNINGRRLILVDCNTLNQMGMSDLTEMRKVTAKIRELLKIPKPNILRALMRIPPYEAFLRRKIASGPNADSLTFEAFCKSEGFNYIMLKGNKNAAIPCTCEVRILPLGVLDDDDEIYEEGDDEDLSLLNAPTVEFIVRTSFIRDKTVSLIIEEMLKNVFAPNSKRKYGKIMKTFQEAIYRGYEDLEMMDSDERIDFAAAIARSLLDELEHTAEILSDINLLQKYIDEEVSPARLEYLRECAEEFMENILPIASLLALGELDLETIFRQEPEFEEFVDDIIDEAEFIVEDMLPRTTSSTILAMDILDDIIEDAFQRADQDQQQDVQHGSVQVDFPENAGDEVGYGEEKEGGKGQGQGKKGHVTGSHQPNNQHKVITGNSKRFARS